jgi:hypothetical protein
MKKIALALSILLLSGCSTIDTVKKYWPRPHDPVMFNQLIATGIAIEKVDCEKADWAHSNNLAEQLARYTEWRKDPQSENMRGLQKHTERMSKGGSKTFCEIGKKTAHQRIEAAKSAWEGR